MHQTGMYVVRAEDLPRASKLPCTQRIIKRAEYHFILNSLYRVKLQKTDLQTALLIYKN